MALVMVVLLCANLHAQPRHVYLTWQSNPSTTMTVNVQTEDVSDLQVLYDTRHSSGAPFRNWARGGADKLER